MTCLQQRLPLSTPFPSLAVPLMVAELEAGFLASAEARRLLRFRPVPGRRDRLAHVFTNARSVLGMILHAELRVTVLEAGPVEVQSAWELLTTDPEWRGRVAVRQLTISCLRAPVPGQETPVPEPPQDPRLGLVDCAVFWAWLARVYPSRRTRGAYRALRDMMGPRRRRGVAVAARC